MFRQSTNKLNNFHFKILIIIVFITCPRPSFLGGHWFTLGHVIAHETYFSLKDIKLIKLKV